MCGGLALFLIKMIFIKIGKKVALSRCFPLLPVPRIFVNPARKNSAPSPRGVPRSIVIVVLQILFYLFQNEHQIHDP
jgi:hypothetical protein